MSNLFTTLLDGDALRSQIVFLCRCLAHVTLPLLPLRR